MKKFLSNYKSTIILLVALIVGAAVGLIFKEKATVLKPLGDIFLNLLLVIIVPLIFLTITTSVAKMKQPKRLGKIIGSIILMFVITSIIAVLIGFVSTYFVKLVNTLDLTPDQLLNHDINVMCEEEIPYTFKISKKEMRLIKELRKNEDEYKKLLKKFEIE